MSIKYKFWIFSFWLSAHRQDQMLFTLILPFITTRCRYTYTIISIKLITNLHPNMYRYIQYRLDSYWLVPWNTVFHLPKKIIFTQQLLLLFQHHNPNLSPVAMRLFPVKSLLFLSLLPFRQNISVCLLLLPHLSSTCAPFFSQPISSRAPLSMELLSVDNSLRSSSRGCVRREKQTAVPPTSLCSFISTRHCEPSRKLVRYLPTHLHPIMAHTKRDMNHHHHHHHHQHHHGNNNNNNNNAIRDSNRFQVLCHEQVIRLQEVMETEIPIHGRRGNFPTILLKLRDLVKAVKTRLEEEGIAVRDVRLNGGAASYIIGKFFKLFLSCYAC